MQNVAILIFDAVELLDFTGPYQVFSSCGEWGDSFYFNTYTVSRDGQPIVAHRGLNVTPHYSLENMPKPDILVIPGGNGVYPLTDEVWLHDLIKTHVANHQLLLSVCTGALLLAKAGVLAGQSATTYHTRFDRLQAYEPTVTVKRQTRWVDNGQIVTSAGVSAGIDMSLHVIQRLLGKDIAEKTAEYIEYEYWHAE